MSDRYDKARERARKLYNELKEMHLDNAARDILKIFPDLAESEDERIRKDIRLVVESSATKYFKETGQMPEWYDRIVAYLEKQKEQIPYTDFVIKPHKGDENNPYDMRVFEAQEYAIKRGFGIPFNDGEVYVDERHLTQTIGNILRWADEHPKEQKPAEWSEEDEDMLNSCISSIEEAKENRYAYKETDGDTSYDHEIAWLKSLRPSWRPSEEQMNALLNAEEYLREGDQFDSAKSIAKLYEQLKKLGVKEEPEYYQHFDPDC